MRLPLTMINALIIITLAFLFWGNGVWSKETTHSLETRYIELPLDHFSAYSTCNTFKLRYLISAKYHVKGGPAFVYLGHEKDVTIFPKSSGFLFEIAQRFNGLVVFIEHRYYGQSLPFGNGSFSSPENLRSVEVSRALTSPMRSLATTERHLTTAQALADIACVITKLRDMHYPEYPPNKSSPFIAFGGFYGGMLASWLRLKYPHTVRGAIASSAPIFSFPGLTACDVFNKKVTEVFQNYGEPQCVKIIKLGWDVIINLSKTKLGMDFISSSWKLCRRIKSTEDVEKLLAWLGNIYVKLAMTNFHYPTNVEAPLPAFPVKVFCDKLTTSYFNDTRGLIETFGLALGIYTNYTGQRICNNINSTYEDFNEFAWDYQTCTELIFPRCSTENDMFITQPWDYKKYSMDCYKKFGVKAPIPDWMLIEFGGKNLNYNSNVVFSNGMMDPHSCGGVLQNMSSTIWSINIKDAPHCADLGSSDRADNDYLSDARQFEMHVIKQWIKEE